MCFSSGLSTEQEFPISAQSRWQETGLATNHQCSPWPDYSRRRAKENISDKGTQIVDTLNQAVAEFATDDLLPLKRVDDKIDDVHDHAQGHWGKEHRDSFSCPYGNEVRAGNDEHEPQVG